MQLNKTLIFCLASVYIIWGSTYFAIVYAIQSIPPWTVSAGRFFLASILMLALSVFKKEEKLSPAEKKISGLSGLLMILGNGIVCVVEKSVSSGLVAVLLGAAPIWIMLVGWAGFQQTKPTLQKFIGALIGLVGVALIASGAMQPGAHDENWGLLLLLISSLAWATGTLLQRKLPPVKSPLRFSAWQMFSGAWLALAMSLIFEKPWEISPSDITTTSILATLYLVVFGSMIGFTAYAWLSRNVEPHLTSTYALVNPVIAVWLGWFFLNEPVTAKFFGGTFLVLAGLTLLIVKFRRPISS